MKIKIFEERAIAIFKILDYLWKKKEFPFQNITLSQDRWPLPQSPGDIANYFFFCSLSMRGSVNSDDPFKTFHFLYQKYPDLFSPEKVVDSWSPDTIQNAIREIVAETKNIESTGTGGPLGYKLKEHAKHWYENAITLHTYWGGDILNVYKYGISDFEDAFRRIDNNITQTGFKGMRRKIFALLTIWLQEKELVPLFPTPIPIDFHALRILWATKSISVAPTKNAPEIIDGTYPMLKGLPAVRVTEELINRIMTWSQDSVIEKGLSHIAINPALWVISRDLCSNQLQNKTNDTKIIRGKPISQTFFTPDFLKKNPRFWPQNYSDPCHYCPLARFCTGVMPSNPYYRDGIMARIPRVEYPFKKQTLPGMQKFFPFNGRRKSVLSAPHC